MKRLISALVPVFCVAAPLGAQSAPPTLRDAVAIALRQSPDILFARLRTDSARGEQRIARAIPNLGATIAPQNPYQYSLTEALDIGPQRLYRTRAAGRGTAATLLDLADVERQTTFAVRQAFYDVLLAQAQRDLSAERRDIFRQLLAADSVRLRSGDISQRDVTKAELEFSRAEADLTRAVAGLHAARLYLQLLMGITSPDTAYAVAGDLSFQAVDVPVDSLGAIAMRERPDIRAADERVQQSRALRGLAGSEWVPLPSVSAVYQSQPFTNGAYVNFGFGFTIPFPYLYGGERERAQAGLDASVVQSRRIRTQAATDVATAFDAYRSARGLAERYEGGLLGKARTVLETARYAYGTGAISLLELLDAITTWSDTRSDYYTAVHDYWVSLFALSRSVGRDLVP